MFESPMDGQRVSATRNSTKSQLVYLISSRTLYFRTALGAEKKSRKKLNLLATYTFVFFLQSNQELVVQLFVDD